MIPPAVDLMTIQKEAAAARAARNAQGQAVKAVNVLCAANPSALDSMLPLPVIACY
jgi:hypothetical protein